MSNKPQVVLTVQVWGPCLENQWSLGQALACYVTQSVTSVESSDPVGLLYLFTCLLTFLNSGVLKGDSLFLQKCLVVEGVQRDFVES